MSDSCSPPARPRRALLGAALLAGACAGPVAHGFTVGIDRGPRALYLQVGVGRMTGGTFNNGATPSDNATVNTSSVSVPAAQLGSGTAQPMTTSSTVTASSWDGFAFCNSPASTGQVYVAGFYRTNSTSGNAASLTVTTPANLSNAAGDTIAFNRVAWTSAGNGDTGITIPAGTFTGATQNLLSVANNSWFESCLAFRYLNTQLVAAGTFRGTATYTLTAP